MFLDGFVSLIDLIANPVFAVVINGKLLISLWIFVHDLLNKTGDVPEFVTEVTAGDNFASAEGLINAGRTTSDKAETKCVGAVLANNLDRIDDVAFRFRHLLSFFIKHHTVHVDIFEWDIASNVEAKHNHATNPLE